MEGGCNLGLAEGNVYIAQDKLEPDAVAVIVAAAAIIVAAAFAGVVGHVRRRKEHAPAQGGGAPQNGATRWLRALRIAGSAPRHMTPCACHCAACRAAGHGNTCVMVSLALVQRP